MALEAISFRVLGWEPAAALEEEENVSKGFPTVPLALIRRVGSCRAIRRMTLET